MSQLPKRGELWWYEPGGSAASAGRPVLVLSRDAAILHLKRVVVAPCTTTVRGLPSEVVLEPGEDPLPRRCAVNLDALERVHIESLGERLGALSERRMREVCIALAVALDFADLLAPDAPVGEDPLPPAAAGRSGMLERRPPARTARL